MSAAEKLKRITVEEYLEGELRSSVKHEYLGGEIYAMAGARNVHNVIAGNVFASAHARLRGQRCRPFNSDTKVRILLPRQVRFYYPDVSVVCRPNPPADSFQDEPALLMEVISRRTRRLDEGEKMDAYLTIPSLFAYLLVEQVAPAVAVWRRANGTFARDVYEGMDAVIPLDEIGLELPLAEIYEGVEFIPEPIQDE